MTSPSRCLHPHWDLTSAGLGVMAFVVSSSLERGGKHRSCRQTGQLAPALTEYLKPRQPPVGSRRQRPTATPTVASDSAAVTRLKRHYLRKSGTQRGGGEKWRSDLSEQGRSPVPIEWGYKFLMITPEEEGGVTELKQLQVNRWGRFQYCPFSDSDLCVCACVCVWPCRCLHPCISVCFFS